MQIYVINGSQYTEDKLPPGVTVDDAQTLEEYLAANRVAARPAVPAGTDQELVATITARDDLIATLEQQAAERDARIGQLEAALTERDAQLAAVSTPAEKPEKPAKGR